MAFPEPPDLRWLEYLKIAFGYCLLFVFAGLIAMIALGRVEETTSHGLMPLIVALAGMGGAWTQAIFGSKKE
jgi:hypothetical protein